jgi:hypothetical protein
VPEALNQIRNKIWDLKKKWGNPPCPPPEGKFLRFFFQKKKKCLELHEMAITEVLSDSFL